MNKVIKLSKVVKADQKMSRDGDCASTVRTSCPVTGCNGRQAGLGDRQLLHGAIGGDRGTCASRDVHTGRTERAHKGLGEVCMGNIPRRA